MGAVLAFIQRLNGEGNDFMKRIVTVDETSINHVTQIRNNLCNVQTYWFSVFMGRTGHFVIGIYPARHTIIAESYSERYRTKGVAYELSKTAKFNE